MTSLYDIAARDVAAILGWRCRLAGDFAGLARRMRRKHAAAAEHLHHIVAFCSTGFCERLFEQLHGLFGEQAARNVTRRTTTPADGQKVVTHSSEVQHRVPSRNGHAGTEDGTQTDITGCEVEFTRVEENVG